MFKQMLMVILLMIVIGCSDFLFDSGRKTDIWYNITPNETDLYTDVYFINKMEGWVAGKTRCRKNDPCPGWSSVVYHTKDGGKNWRRVLITAAIGGLNSVHFFDNLTGIAMRRNVYRTDDGGASWIEVTKLAGSPIVRDIEVDDQSIIWAGAQDSEIGGAVVLNSEDGLKTWKVLDDSFRKGGVYLSISAPTPTTIYAAGFSTPSKALLVKTRNAGETWEDVPLPGNTDGEGERYYCIDFVDESTGWLGGLFGAIYHTTDGGETWRNLDTGSRSAAIYDIDAIDTGHIVAVTSDGKALVTKDGGNTWDEHTIGGSEHPYGRVQYYESGVVFAVGNGVAFTARLSY